MKIVYKFRNWENEHHKKMLKDNTIHFASPNSFNDPFDSTIPFRYDLISDKELLKAYYKIIKKDKPNISRQEMRNKAREELKKGIVKSPDYPEKAREIIGQYNANMFGIFSIAGKYDDLLMWSHYANNHKGFCMGFKYELLIEYCTQHFFKKEKVLESRPVIYQEDYPIIIPTIEDDIEFMIRPLTYKSKVWEYENEYRLIVYEGANVDVVIPSEIFEGIVLGCKMSLEMKNEIKAIADKKNIPIADSKMHLEKYALQYRKY
jgi:hypothetical protein